MSDKSDNLNKFSKRITEPKSQGASQAMLYGTGMTEVDIQLVISGYPFIQI